MIASVAPTWTPTTSPSSGNRISRTSGPRCMTRTTRSCECPGRHPTPPATASRASQPWHHGPRAGPESTLGTTRARVTGEQQAQGGSRTGPWGSRLVGPPEASLRRWCLSGRGQWEPRQEKWVDGCFLAPPPPLLLHSRKVAGSCVGRALPAAPSLEGRAEGVGEDRLSRHS